MKRNLVWSAVSLLLMIAAMLLVGIDLIGEFGWLKLASLLFLAGGFIAFVYSVRFHTWQDVAKNVVEVLEQEQVKQGCDWHGEGV